MGRIDVESQDWLQRGNFFFYHVHIPSSKNNKEKTMVLRLGQT